MEYKFRPYKGDKMIDLISYVKDKISVLVNSPIKLLNNKSKK